MSLPILPSKRPAATTDDLVRLYHRTELHWVRQVSEETSLDCGSAFTNPALPNVYDANLMLEASIAEGATSADAVAEVDGHFASRGMRCHKWTLNPAVPVERTKPLAEHLIGLGYTPESFDIMCLSGPPATAIAEVGGLQIIPARASFRHARALQEESAAAWKEPQVAEAAMLHIEDPQTDSLIALKDGVAAGLVSVLTVGELGYVADVYVSERYRKQGIGRTLMSRALEICARSLFKHVFLTVDPKNTPAVELYTKLGFRRLAPYVLYRAPQARP